MQLIYADESGDLGLTEASLAKDRWFLLGALCIDESARPVIDDYVVRLKRQFFGRSDPYDPETEIKGSWLRHFEDYVHPPGAPRRDADPHLQHHALDRLDRAGVRALRRSLFDIIDRVESRL